jgi:hypothetical protein
MGYPQPRRRSYGTVLHFCGILFVRAAWFPVLILVVHGILAVGFNAYSQWPPSDMLIHFAGGIAIAYFFERALRVLQSARVLGETETVLRYMLVFALTVSAAVFWEFGEYISDHTIGTQSQLGLNDTLRDMAFGITGGSVYLAGIFARSRQKQSR